MDHFNLLKNMFSPTLPFPKINMNSITVRPLDPEFLKNLTKTDSQLHGQMKNK